jgi:hypothetical protein
VEEKTGPGNAILLKEGQSLLTFALIKALFLNFVAFIREIQHLFTAIRRR